ncbi:hypothetical protein ACIBHY_29750 [Nonomuraea sp. NPDC050547]|uniref:hypothetical protein n=1 Tax=Nonomuraea sp. NPDC050547 TaxID=3364368 RepID=UPI0037A30BA6
MATFDRLTIICAYDNAETETVRRSLGIASNQVWEAGDAAKLGGVSAVKLTIVETPRFHQRPDADAVRQVLHLVSHNSQQVTRATHRGEGMQASSFLSALPDSGLVTKRCKRSEP